MFKEVGNADKELEVVANRTSVAVLIVDSVASDKTLDCPRVSESVFVCQKEKEN